MRPAPFAHHQDHAPRQVVIAKVGFENRAQSATRGRSSTAPGQAKAPLLNSASSWPLVPLVHFLDGLGDAVLVIIVQPETFQPLGSPSLSQSVSLRQVPRQPREARVRAASSPMPDGSP